MDDDLVVACTTDTTPLTILAPANLRHHTCSSLAIRAANGGTVVVQWRMVRCRMGADALARGGLGGAGLCAFGAG